MEHAYPKAYLDDVVEAQGKLFDFVAHNHPDMDTADFIVHYMKSATRKHIDDAQAYVCTMDYKELWDYFQKNEHYSFRPGESLQGFLPDWIGEFYAYYQWYYNLTSAELIDQVPVSYLINAYPGLHDLDLDLAVQKVGPIQTSSLSSLEEAIRAKRN
ncbi:MAG: hypothetical protein J6P54_05000 [Bacteroidales bacterium]|nr:hypothetical protein [Bacteroidales bacterium]